MAYALSDDIKIIDVGWISRSVTSSTVGPTLAAAGLLVFHCIAKVLRTPNHYTRLIIRKFFRTTCKLPIPFSHNKTYIHDRRQTHGAINVLQHSCSESQIIKVGDNLTKSCRKQFWATVYSSIRSSMKVHHAVRVCTSLRWVRQVSRCRKLEWMITYQQGHILQFRSFNRGTQYHTMNNVV